MIQCVDVYWPVTLTLWYGLHITASPILLLEVFSAADRKHIEQETA
jgi:hypothetical protein